MVEGEDNSRENLTDKEPLDIVAPPGWRLETDVENGCQCYVNVISGAKVSENYTLQVSTACTSTKDISSEKTRFVLFSFHFLCIFSLVMMRSVLM